MLAVQPPPPQQPHLSWDVAAVSPIAAAFQPPKLAREPRLPKAELKIFGSEIDAYSRLSGEDGMEAVARVREYSLYMAHGDLGAIAWSKASPAMVLVVVMTERIASLELVGQVFQRSVCEALQLLEGNHVIHVIYRSTITRRL